MWKNKKQKRKRRKTKGIICIPVRMQTRQRSSPLLKCWQLLRYSSVLLWPHRRLEWNFKQARMSCRELTGARVLFPSELLVCLRKLSTCRSLLVWFDCVVKPSVVTLLCLSSHQSFWYVLWFVQMAAVKQNPHCLSKSGLCDGTFKFITSKGLTACVITINLLDVTEWLISVCTLCTKANWRHRSRPI